MIASTINVLRPNLTREAALRALQARGPLGLASRWHRGPLRRLADVYVPFFLYRVQIDSGGRRQTRYFGFDSGFGALDPYEFPRPPMDSETLTLETRNAVRPTLDELAVAEILTDKVRRAIFFRGFFRVRDLNIDVEASGETIHIPYWIGFYGSGQSATLRVIDAVRCRIEGAKMRQALEGWLAE